MIAIAPPYRLNEIKVEVTHRCALQCIHCSSNASESCAREMSKESCLAIVRDASVMGVKQIDFSGGEPLLWQHLEEAIATVREKGMLGRVYTTGCAPHGEERLRRLVAVGADTLIFSLFGASLGPHEQVTTVDGSFQRTVAAIKCATELGTRTEIHFVPMAANYKELRPLAVLGKSLGVPLISVLRFVPQGRGTQEQRSVLNKEHNLELKQLILQLRDEGYDIRTGSPYNFLMVKDQPRCFAGIDRLCVGPDLRIFPCDAFKHIRPGDIGVSAEFSSLDNASLADCWSNSPYLAAVRSYLTTPFAERCRTCKALAKCLSGCVAQKFYACGTLAKVPDPMCLL
ncbi:MAG TPA: radical SAM protein [Planctomycetota bacterium]|nr:radical SAM protein [Planctomycetota bacterium]